MPKAAYIVIGMVVLFAVMFGSPFTGSVLGFCPPSEGTKALMIDSVVTLIYASGLWMIYRGIRPA